eukprot:358597-Chlamydomonas_euryale.AAC.2
MPARRRRSAAAAAAAGRRGSAVTRKWRQPRWMRRAEDASDGGDAPLSCASSSRAWAASDVVSGGGESDRRDGRTKKERGEEAICVGAGKYDERPR